MTGDKNRFCESCGSQVLATNEMPHLCSIKTAKGWRQEIPLHYRRKPFLKPSMPTLKIEDERDWDLYQQWIEEQQDRGAAALVFDKRSGLCIEAVYDNPVAMNLAEKLDFWVNVGRINRAEQEEERGEE